VVRDAGYGDIFKVMDLDEITLSAIHSTQPHRFANVCSGTGGGFDNTEELQVMNYNKAVNGPDGKHWKAEVENKYQQMLANVVFKVVLKTDLLTGTEVIDSNCAMKNKSNETLRG
jgi:hypothetical protein